jgi:NAD(P)-dependent dehydrogenase (short-subunit alcohol dehydrogenase family)
MRILLIGASGTLGSAVGEALGKRGHELVTVGRTAGDVRGDVTNPADVARIFDEAGALDAVVSAAGSVPYKRLTDMTPGDYLSAYHGKVASQVELVRQGTSRVAARGSFTLITGVLSREPIVTGSAAALANGAVEAFVLAAALEIAPQRINAVSPTVVTESLDRYGDVFPGYPPVDLADVARAYLRSVEGAETGKVFRLPA